ncbi:MAG: hypothetical protein JXM70_19050 [Pirellulales bacterium]|nr:hypothetical protein [Pirellulales bacterium]
MNGKNNLIIFNLVLLLIISPLTAENMDPYETDEQYGWGENVGWLNFEPNEGAGVQIEGDKLTGFVWAENIGWINLSCETTSYCKTVKFGVVNDGAGNLSGFAWGENVGWINFDPAVPGDKANQYKVTIAADGRFNGWAWGENIGWIHFDGTQAWTTRTCIVTIEDLANFAADWLGIGSLPGDFDGDGYVDLTDFSLIAEKWLDYCPDSWPLK